MKNNKNNIKKQIFSYVATILLVTIVLTPTVLAIPSLPNTEITIDANPMTVYKNDPVVLTIKEDNIGNVPLTNPYIVLNPGGIIYNNESTEFIDTSDANSDGKLDTNEIWEWHITVNPTTTTTYQADGHGIDVFCRDICYDNGYTDERDSVQVEVIFEQGCTYTPGYWKTHSIYGPAPYDPTWATIGPDGVTELQNHSFYNTGYTWGEIMSIKTNSKTHTYQHLAFHYVAAYLNNIFNDGEPLHISENMSEAETILDTYDNSPYNMKIPKNSADEALAKKFASILGWFNEGCYPGWHHCDEEYGSITIKIYNDKNENYTFDDDDEYITEGWDITRDSGPCPCNPDETKTTDSNGQVYFDNLKPGTYLITIDVPTGWIGPEQISVEVSNGGAIVQELPYHLDYGQLANKGILASYFFKIFFSIKSFFSILKK